MFRELTVDEWFEEIAQGLEYRRDYGMENKWAELEALASNAHAISSVGPNIIYAMQDDLVSSLNVPNPVVLVSARSSLEVDSAPIVDAVDNDLIQQLNMPFEVDIGTSGAYLWGTSVFKIGYDSEYGWAPELDFNGQQQPMGLSLTQIDRKGRFIEFNEFEPGMPWFKFCAPHDIVVPWGTRDLRSAVWIAHRVCRHHEDCKADSKYTTRGLKPMMSYKDFVKSYTTVIKPYRIGVEDFFRSTTEWENENEYNELWEIHDRRTRKIFVIATGHKQFLRNEPDALQLDGLPFVEMRFTPRTRCFWGTSDAHYLYHAQAELSDIAIQSAKQRRIDTLKFLYNKQQITQEELNKILSSEVGVAAAVNGGGDIRNVIMSLPSRGNYQLHEEADFVRSNARETTGFTKTQAGEYAGARTTGFEVQQVQGARQMRMTRRQMIVANTYTEAMRKINAIVFKYWTGPRMIQIVGPEGLPAWQSFIGTQLQGKYNYKITFQDAPFESIEQQQAMAQQAYMMAAQDPSMDVNAARRYLATSQRSPSLRQIINPQQGGMPGGGAPGQGQGQGRIPGGGQAGPGAGQAGPPQAAMQGGR